MSTDTSGNQPEQADDWRPPYISYTTLTNFIDDRLGANPLPPRIDRAFLDNYAGSVQLMLLGTLRTMGLIDANGVVLPPLGMAARHPNERKAVVKAWAEGFYQDQQVLASNNATAGQLWESFAKYKLSGSTLRKAVVFYLMLCDDVGLTTSPHFKAPRQTPRTSARPRKQAAPHIEEPTVVSSTPRSVPGEQKTISLGPAGSVTITVDVRWLELPDKTFTALRQVIRELETLAVADPASVTREEGNAEATEAHDT